MTNHTTEAEASAAAADQTVEIIEEASDHEHLGNKNTLLRFFLSFGLLVVMVIILVDVLGQPADSVMMTAGQFAAAKATKPPRGVRAGKAPKTPKAPKPPPPCPWPLNLNTKLCGETVNTDFITFDVCPFEVVLGKDFGSYSISGSRARRSKAEVNVSSRFPSSLGNFSQQR